MRHFKLPIIITGITLFVAVAAGIGVVTWIYKSKISDREKTERAQKLGGAFAIVTLLIITPPWLFAAAKFGKERRAQQEADKAAAEGGQSSEQS
jgi:flagellar basal body-associated protein FliL